MLSAKNQDWDSVSTDVGSGIYAVLEAASGSDQPWAASLGWVQDLGSAPAPAAAKIRRFADPP